MLGVYFLFNPAGNPLFPKCPFLLLTKFKCPGCGSQRAIHQLMHFNFLEAFHYNALLVILLPLMAWLFFVDLFRKKRPSWYRKTHHPQFIWVLFSVILIWWFARNVFSW